MNKTVLLDTGPLVAFLKRNDRFHTWSNSTLRTCHYPLITCEPVITEACFLLSDTYGGHAAVMALLKEGALKIDFSINKNANALDMLIDKYKSVPMSLADACLVRMAELNQGIPIVTCDSDFRIYRMRRNQMIPVIMPDS